MKINIVQLMSGLREALKIQRKLWQEFFDGIQKAKIWLWDLKRTIDWYCALMGAKQVSTTLYHLHLSVFYVISRHSYKAEPSPTVKTAGRKTIYFTILICSYLLRYQLKLLLYLLMCILGLCGEGLHSVNLYVPHS